MAILPFRKQKMSTNGIKPSLTQEELERGKQLQKALKKSKNTKEAAKLLGISQPTFSRKYNKYKNQGIL